MSIHLIFVSSYLAMLSFQNAYYIKPYIIKANKALRLIYFKVWKLVQDNIRQKAMVQKELNVLSKKSTTWLNNTQHIWLL